mgnify:CR=1 FL=1
MSLSDLAPVHLDELNEAAEFMSRVDRKYPLHQRAAEAILDCLPTGTRVLSIGGRTEFGYTSIYFDTMTRDSYLLAARGRPHRFKVRVRHYRDSGDAFLEVKTRHGGSTIKERIPHDPAALFEITPEQYGFISDRLTAGGIRGIRPQWLKPSLETTYLRTTLLAADRRSRLTLDRELVWTGDGHSMRFPRLAIIETKSGSAPSSADRILWHHGYRPQRISKYATGLAALHPELPANRWHRVLNRHF